MKINNITVTVISLSWVFVVLAVAASVISTWRDVAQIAAEAEMFTASEQTHRENLQREWFTAQQENQLQRLLRGEQR